MLTKQDVITWSPKTPILISFQTENICFERDKSVIWEWRSDRTKDVNEHQCKVRSAQLYMIHILFSVNIFWALYPLSHKPIKDPRQIDSLNPPHYLF